MKKKTKSVTRDNTGKPFPGGVDPSDRVELLFKKYGGRGFMSPEGFKKLEAFRGKRRMGTIAKGDYDVYDNIGAGESRAATFRACGNVTVKR